MASASSEDNEKAVENFEIDTLPDPIAVANEQEIIAAPNSHVDGGKRAWLQVIGSFLVFFNIWGFTFAYGTFQSYYELTYLTNISGSAISWIGTVSSFLLIVIGVFSGSLFDLGYFKSMLCIGAFLGLLGIFTLSLSTQYYQIFLTQGICMGLGSGFLYMPGLALVGRSFTKHRSIALGIVSCGAPLGGIIYTLIFDNLISHMSFGWCVRIMGFLMLASYLIAFPLLLWGTDNTGDIGSGTARKLFDKAALKDIPFWSYTVANFFIFCGYLVPFFFLPSYGQQQLNTSRSTALNTLMITQGVSIVGRMIAAVIAHFTGVMIPWIVCGLTSGIFCLAWISVQNVGTYITIAALYGFFSGALIPLPPSIFPIVCPDRTVLGARMGMAQAIGAIASLIGSPIAGALAQLGGPNQQNHYLGLQLWSGLTMLFGVCNLFGLWIILIRMRNCKRLI